jgi:pyruvate dehydrogenase E2 component (dihydrolipoamide acetyltransferase)
MARVEVPMPQMGESIAEGTVSVWLKKVGDVIERDEPIMEIATDKVDAEIPSPAAGILAEIVVSEGETVEVGTVVAFIETEAGAVAPPVPAPRQGSPQEEPATPIPVEAEPKAQRDASAESAGKTRAPAERAPGLESAEERLRRRSTPLVRRIAAEHDVDLGEVDGTGRAGRVTKADILQYVEGRGPRGAKRGKRLATTEGTAGAFSWDAFYDEVHHPEVEARPGDRVERMSRMTALIAEHMVLSKRIAAHVHSYFEIDYSRIDQVRAANRRVWEEQGVKVTYTAFIARAVAQALREHPRINASVSGDNVVYRAEVNIGIAVALEWGLIVPVVRNADELSLVGIALSLADLAERARTKKLSPEEVQGGTFTITNPGVFGTVIGFPIVNQPQVAIMGVGAVEKRPVVITDQFGNDAIVARKRGLLSLGYDHRLVNGADADRFLARVKEILESFPETS